MSSLASGKEAQRERSPGCGGSRVAEFFERGRAWASQGKLLLSAERQLGIQEIKGLTFRQNWRRHHEKIIGAAHAQSLGDFPLQITLSSGEEALSAPSRSPPDASRRRESDRLSGRRSLLPRGSIPSRWFQSSRGLIRRAAKPPDCGQGLELVPVFAVQHRPAGSSQFAAKGIGGLEVLGLLGGPTLLGQGGNGGDRRGGGRPRSGAQGAGAQPGIGFGHPALSAVMENDEQGSEGGRYVPESSCSAAHTGSRARPPPLSPSDCQKECSLVSALSAAFKESRVKLSCFRGWPASSA